MGDSITPEKLSPDGVTGTLELWFLWGLLANQKKDDKIGISLNFLVNMGLDTRKPVFRGFANNTGTDQPAHLCSLISAFVIRFLESTICKLATGEISIFYIVSVAEETVLKLALSETHGDRFCCVKAHIKESNK